MSKLTYTTTAGHYRSDDADRPLVWLHGEIKTPPFDCHELRVRDVGHQWRVIYRIDDDAIVIVAVFAKKTVRTPTEIIEVCRQRLRRYDDAQEKAQSPGS